MLRLVRRSRHEEDNATTDRVALCDGSIVEVRRADLSAAKALLAAEKMAQRRLAATQASHREPTPDRGATA